MFTWLKQSQLGWSQGATQLRQSPVPMAMHWCGLFFSADKGMVL